ncbi:MAG: fumarylacetoacetate hydrolase family protein [Fimbriimonadaceae bacterium]
MKLCRFETVASPGQARSGIYFEGKVYETDGHRAIGVHAAQDVRFLSPIARPSSLRFAEPDSSTRPVAYVYGNPALVGAGQSTVELPEGGTGLRFVPQVAAVLETTGRELDIEEADQSVLGFLAAGFLTGTEARDARDWAISVAATLATRDEFDDRSTPTENGRRYHLHGVLSKNGEKVGEGSAIPKAATVAETVSACSQTGGVFSGDLILLGPVLEQDSNMPLTVGVLPGDTVTFAVDLLGVLTVHFT